MEADLVVNSHVVIPGSELDVSVSRASGPGGQHVNKTSSRVSLRWNVRDSLALTDAERALVMNRLKGRLVGASELLIHVESERSQLRNRQIARERLAQLVKEALRPEKPRVATKPTKAAKAKRIMGKKRRSLIKKLRRFIEKD
ncbi:MAG TPA: alternative ribosome rescue aminoacyl-tRNA hydrolase ArfB [Myxococcota bacterium]|nr:alternative ribosome rescue aminoacyl-tRNA hydrolase ArfB [Myxococcota bacterium]